jgi:hypothetical protein
MQFSQRSVRWVCLCTFAVWAIPNVGLAGDEVLFRYAIALQNETGKAKLPDLERQWCFDALARLERERETMRLPGSVVTHQ